MVLVYGLLVLALTFMYWMGQTVFLMIFSKEKHQRFIKKNYFVFWFLLVIFMALLQGINFNFPVVYLNAVDHLILVALIVPFMFNSNYKPHQSMKGLLAFCLLFPVGEELVFRGIIPNIIYNNFTNQVVSFPLLKEVSVAVLISSLLFGIMHLQYFNFKINHDTVKKVLFAFVFGLVLGNVAELTESLFYPILFHILANLGAAYVSYKRGLSKRTL